MPNISVSTLFSGNSVAGPQVNATAAGGGGKAGGQASLQSGKAGAQTLKTALGSVQKVAPTVAKNNTSNYNTSIGFNRDLKTDITNFKTSLGDQGGSSPFGVSSYNPSSTFDLGTATNALKFAASDFTTNDLLPGTSKAADSITTANNLGKETLGALNDVADALPGVLGTIAQGGIQIASGITMTTNPKTVIPGWLLVAAGTITTITGLADGSQNQTNASKAQEDTAPKGDQAYQQALAQMLATGGQNTAMQELYQGLNLQALPALNGAQQGVNGLNGLLAQIDPSQASQANLTAGLPSVSGAPTSTASAPVDTSWNTPATPTPPTTASSNSPAGSSASTWNTAPSSPDPASSANGPEDPNLALKRQFVAAFEGQQGKGAGAGATDLAQGLIAQAPTGFNREALGPLAVQDVGQNTQLAQAYERFKAEIEAQKNGGNQANPMMPQANPMAQAGGVDANGQAGAGNTPNGQPTAQNGQGSVANAPVASAQGQPGQPAPQATSVASAPAVADASWGASAPPTAPGLTIPQPVAKTPATLTAGLSQPAFV
jgi:hypothetical protein